MRAMRPTSRDEFEIAIICALTVEADVVEAVFDEKFDKFSTIYGRQVGDSNTYINGSIGSHNVVLCYLPDAGVGSAATAAATLRVSYNHIQLALVVGVCGAVPFPSRNTEIVLGDVIIGDHIVPYDLGRQNTDKFQRKTDIREVPGRQNWDIRSFVAGLKGTTTRHELRDQTFVYLQKLQALPDSVWKYPGSANDILYEPSYRHKHYARDAVPDCTVCSQCVASSDPVCDQVSNQSCQSLGCSGRLVSRSRLKEEIVQPAIHIGTIACANTVMKSGEHRDAIQDEENVLAFEMEAAGVWDRLPCLVIKGACDYADSHKNDSWQAYAAATAASCAKALLAVWQPASSIQRPLAQTRQGLWLMPFERNEGFVGREAELFRLEQGLMTQDRFSKMALFALGGMGKTSIAIELVYRARDKHPNCSVFWVTSTNTESFEKSYREIANQLGLDTQSRDVKTLVMEHLSRANAGPWLMVCDNADDIDAWFKREEAGGPRLADYVPNSQHGSVLLTTRTEQVARKFAARSVLKVPQMDMETSVQLLEKNLCHEDAAVSLNEKHELLENLFYIPLAIVQAGTYITVNYITVSDYLSLLNDTEENLVTTLSEDFEDDWRYPDQKNPIAATWIVSFQQIQLKNPLAAEYLSFMSLIAPKAIPKELLPPGPSSKGQTEALACLISYSFLSKQVDNNYDIHRLVHLITRNWLKRSGHYEKYYLQVMSRLAEVCPMPTHWFIEDCDKFVPHMHFLMSMDRPQIQMDHKFLWKYGQEMHVGRQPWEAEAFFAEAASVAKRTCGPEHIETLVIMGHHAMAYSLLSCDEEAEKLLTHVAEVFERRSEVEDQDKLMLQFMSAAHIMAKQRWQGFKPLQNAIKVCGDIICDEHIELVVPMCSWAHWQVSWDDDDDDDDYDSPVIWLGAVNLTNFVESEKKLTPTSNYDLEVRYRLHGQLSQNQDILVRIFGFGFLKSGEYVSDYSICKLQCLGMGFMDQIRSAWMPYEVHREDVELLLQIMDVFQNKCGSGEPDPKLTEQMFYLASLYMSFGRWEAAEQLLLQVIEISREVYEDNHPDSVRNLVGLALARQYLGRTQEALSQMKTAVEISEKIFGPDHEVTRHVLKWVDKFSRSAALNSNILDESWVVLLPQSNLH